MSTIDTEFSAKEPSLGYFYQIKYALLLLLNQSKELNNPKVRIENLDDVEIEDLKTMILYQTKLHIKSKANLTDSSVDFWKTIRIWSEHILQNIIDLENTSFNLITTEEIPESSFLIKFKKTDLSDDDITDLVNRLDDVAINSTNVTNKKAYEAFQKLSIENKKKLLKKITIIDKSVGMEEVNSKIKKELIFSTYPERLDAFLEILEGWWLKKSIENLSSKIDYIDSQELQLKIANISESFTADNLPNHFPDQIEVSEEDIDSLKDKKFLKQLELIQLKIKSGTVKRAISDFRRAFEQRSKWMRLQLLNPDEEEEYDRRLQDHWRNIFDIMCDLADGKKSEELQALGKDFYLEQFAKTCPQIKIREKFNEDYLTRGSYQMLSDMKKVGWHPKYNEEL
ncbi:ABC-three component system protein [Emticicia sp. 17c]|uniref:ABC-three component system protein n=1 Tax=Emticicia sp. 17c TaxID=3127704 RepID=UPI00301CC0A5